MKNVLEIMNEQEIIANIIVAISLLWIAWRMIHYIKRIRKNESACGGCGCDGCPASRNCPNEKNSDFIEIFRPNACGFKK